MKLASLKDGRDGRLVVVSRDLTRYADAAHIAPTLQNALDFWKRAEPRLYTLAEEVELGSVPTERFHEKYCASPLPRAYQWADGSAYVNHVQLVRKARGAEMPESFWTEPLMYQGGSDAFLGPRDPIPLADESWGCDLEGEIAVITGDVRIGADQEAAQRSIRLLMLANDVSLRNLIPHELGKGFGFFQSKPSSAFSPVAITPDELGPMWDGHRLHGTLCVKLNGEVFGKAQTAVDMTFDFPTLIQHASKTRPLSAGSIVGSGTVSNRDADGGPGRPVADGGVGYSCIAELRMVETITTGAPKTPFLKRGDRVEIDMTDERGHSIFGRIEQTVEG
ncbi:MAG TPA: fumarylacetoacetate hydrolase family protein [Hyphomonadaceae bacterium]|jgi:fumarylacetoacetate (FAA) hydrolase|nr:fumarylacetoacetate hydrolase family protein [Hyphomonadaceae bacterium]